MKEIVTKLYDYQKEIFNLMLNRFNLIKETRYSLELKDRSFLNVLPTGMGKTFTFASFVAYLFSIEEIENCLFLVHKHELCEQIKNEFLGLGVPRNKIDLVIQSKPRRREITIATFQSLIAGDMWRLNKIFSPDIIVVDECHLSAAHSYQQILKKFHSINFGFTATPVRVLPESKKIFINTWTMLYQKYTLKKAIDDGYLCNLKYYRINLSKLGIKKEDENRYNVGLVNNEIIDKYVEFGGGKFLIFANSVEHSKKLKGLFNDAGILAYHVDGTTNKHDRKRILKEFTEHHMNKNIVLCNYNVYTEGINIPNLKGVVIACKLSSKSIVKFLQMIGRSTRKYLHKEFAYILEVRNNRSRTLNEALDKIFRMYYQDVEPQYDDYDDEDEKIEDEELTQEIEDSCVTLEKAEMELQTFFSPLPSTLLHSNLNWKSCIDGIYYCNIDDFKRLEIRKIEGKYELTGIGEDKKFLGLRDNLQETNDYASFLVYRWYKSTYYIWNKPSIEKDSKPTEKQIKLLKRKNYEIEGMTKNKASEIIDMMQEKRRFEPISAKQQRYLFAIGYRGNPTLINKQNVGKIIAKLKG